jgi:tetratricopeptide (TPR) repeat protein
VEAGALVASRDGSYLGVIEPNRHWQIARRILDYVKMTPVPDPFVGDWYHAVAAFMHRFSYFGELAPHLQQAEKLLPGDGRVQFDLGVLWENRGLPRAQQLLADEHLRNERFPPGRVRPSFESSIDVPAPEVANRRAEDRFRRALELDPALVEARVRLARLLGVRGRQQEARREAEAALYGTLGGTTAYYAHLFAGRAAAAERDLRSASSHFDAALALYPGAQSALLAQSQAALMRGDDGEAAKVLEVLSRAATRRSLAEDPWWYYHMGPGRDARELLSALWQRVD